MPAEAFGLLALFTIASIVAGVGAWWLVGPRSWWGLPLPVLAAFGALYLSGHRLGWELGPTVQLFGFQVALLFDLVLAVVVAVLAALVQRPLLRRATRAGGAAPR